mmetsp:Transcript_12789/g.31084  ORF Transcript_12789/g.31084 Transcript_12789/m.31084 type:complete len:170 (-) Transcript_12789:305-814(-)
MFRVAGTVLARSVRTPSQVALVPMVPHHLASRTRSFAAASKYYDNTKAKQDFERSKAMLDRQSATDDSLKSGAAPPGGRGLPSASTANGKASATAATAPEPTSPSKVTAATLRDQQKVLFPRLTEEASDADFEEVGKGEKLAKEVGFKYLGKEPTSYGDWSHKGRVTDF